MYKKSESDKQVATTRIESVIALGGTNREAAMRAASVRAGCRGRRESCPTSTLFLSRSKYDGMPHRAT
jgi:hypothetical protein